MSKREFLVIVCIALALAIALPFMAQSFMPRKAEPEPLPGVPFSTAPTEQATLISIRAPEPMPTVIQGRVIVVNTEIPVPATVEWYIERSNVGDIPVNKPQKVQADERGHFEILLPAVKQASRFLIWAKATYVDFEPVNLVGGWQDSGTTADLGVIEMRAYSRVNVVWRRQAEQSVVGRYVAFRHLPTRQADPSRGLAAQFNDEGEAWTRLAYGRWAVSFLTNPEMPDTKTRIPAVKIVEINQPMHVLELEKLCESGTGSLRVEVVDQLGNPLASAVVVDRIGPGHSTGEAGQGNGTLAGR